MFPFIVGDLSLLRNEIRKKDDALKKLTSELEQQNEDSLRSLKQLEKQRIR